MSLKAANVRDRAYVFLSPSVGEIGGAERYLNAKAQWLRERGWSVVILTSHLGSIPFDYGDAKIFRMPELLFRPSCTTAKHIDHILSEVFEELKRYSFVYIESSIISFSFWGEMIAARVGGKHLVFHLGESAPDLTEQELAYLSFKARRNELACIKEKIFLDIFSDVSVPCENAVESRVLVASGGSPVQDVPFDMSKIPKRDCCIGCISRLDKTYLLSAFESVVRFCADNEDLCVVLVVVGDAAVPSKKEQLAQFEKRASNLRIVFLGSLNPIPRNLVKTFDVAMGKAGSSWATANEGVPTIVYALDKDICMGILNVDFYRSPSSNEGKGMRAEILLDKILVKKEIGKTVSSRVGNKTAAPSFENHFRFAQPTVAEASYFDTKNLACSLKSMLISLWVRATKKHPSVFVSRWKSMLLLRGLFS